MLQANMAKFERAEQDLNHSFVVVMILFGASAQPPPPIFCNFACI